VLELLSVPETARNDRTPVVAAEFRGVAIATSRRAPGAPLRVDGVFQIPRADAEQIGPPVHRLLACLVWPEYSVAPFAGAVLFPDDQFERGGAVCGYFGFEMDLPTGFYLHVALGEHLSPTVQV
jgi:hypothetical protein